jgi:hypothetical protein
MESENPDRECHRYEQRPPHQAADQQQRKRQRQALQHANDQLSTPGEYRRDIRQMERRV